MLKSKLGMAPQKLPDGSYEPSKFALKVATSKTTDYKPVNYDKYEGPRKKILVCNTEGDHLVMANGKKFHTGNHPVETLVPMLHLRSAGFEFDIHTPTGKSAKFEMWAFPTKDKNVTAIFEEYKPDFENPKSLADFVANDLDKADEYAAVYFPGGHGALIGLPEDPNVGKLLRWADDNGLFIMSICHGPSAFFSTQLDGDEFLFKGYSLCAFSDWGDRSAPMVGYLPGKITSSLTGRLDKLGAHVVNHMPYDEVHRDRRLITGASPAAAEPLGRLAAETMLAHFKKTEPGDDAKSTGAKSKKATSKKAAASKPTKATKSSSAAGS